MCLTVMVVDSVTTRQDIATAITTLVYASPEHTPTHVKPL